MLPTENPSWAPEIRGIGEIRGHKNLNPTQPKEATPMPLPMRVFAWKHQEARMFLEENGYAALVVTTPANFYMMTGFHLDVEPWERPVAAVFPVDGEPFMVMNSLSTHHLRMCAERETLYVKDYVTYIEHNPYRGRTYTTPQWTDLLAERLAAAGIQRGTLAVDGPCDALAGVRRALPGVQFTNVAPFMMQMREVKHPQELEVMRLAAELSDWGQDRYLELVAPGKLCTVVDAQVSALMYEEAGQRFPERQIELFMLGLSGPASASPHGNGANAGVRFEKGHGAVNIVVVRLDGLVVENERTFFIGQPDDLQRRAYEAATAASVAAGEQMVAGNTVAEIDAAAQAVIEAAGFGEHIFHRTGHGMGIAGHEFPADVAFNHRPLRENEVWSAEPGIYIYGVGGFRQDNTVIVGASQPEVITKRSMTLADQIVPV
jgi:Xaa-Pro aminopeptidase